MSSRRAFVLGGASMAAAVLGYALKPKHFVSLLKPGQRVDHLIPRAFQGWTSQDVSDQFAPQTKDSLMARLYGETVGRIYQDAMTGTRVVVLIAHGDVQSNELQLHRPEVCYPAFGFEIARTFAFELPLAGNVKLPARFMSARSPDHDETVVYWTRLGEEFPTNGGDQRMDRLSAALHGNVPDGILARFSIAGAGSDSAFVSLKTFIGQMLWSVPADGRAVLVGTQRAQEMSQRRSGR